MLKTTLTTKTGNPRLERLEPTIRLKRHQYYFAVLSEDPDSYGFLTKLPTIVPPRDEWSVTGLDTDYVVLLPRPGKPVPLPANPLTWTSIAYVLWDDCDPDVLTPAQQTALLDWLHWGGQLIISGPNSLQRLHGSFLDDYLAAHAGTMKKIRRQLVDQLDDHWYIDQSIGHGVGDLRQSAAAKTAPPPEIVTLQKHAAANFVPRTGRLLVERRVGRGRVVVSAFTLSSRQFVNRKRFDEFFHACVLRRPQRFFALTENQEISVGWADRNRDKYDARRVSSLRFFSRDALPSELASETEGNGTSTTDSQDYLFDTIGYQSDPQSGVAGWSDFSGVATSARDTLQKAAGITVPSASIVCQMLGVYLLFLVPLNWGFFRLIGHG